MFTMFSFMGWFLGRFAMLKKNHCVLPLVFMSFCRIRSYYGVHWLG